MLLLGTVIAICGPRVAEGAYTDAKPLRFKGKFDPFKVLGLPKSQALPSNDVLRKAFKKAALTWHPDRCKRKKPIEECEAKMEEVHLAQDVLQDERRLQQWEAWDEDRRGGPKPEEGGRNKPFGTRAGGAGGGFPNFGGGFGDAFGGMPGGRGGRPKRSPTPRPPPPRRPPPSPRPPPQQEQLPWKVVSVQTSEGMKGSKVELITRERDLPGTPMVQVEIMEKTCYKAQVQCQEQVLERRRRKKGADKEEL